MQMIREKSVNQTALWAWVICSLGAVYYCYEYFLRITPSVITPELMSTYHLTGAEIGNLAAFYYYAYMPMQIVVGLLMDRYGPRRLLTVACLLCAVGTGLFAGNHGFGIAALGRFFVGFGSAFAFVGALKLATIWLPPNRFAMISGIIMCLGMIGAMAGDILLHDMVVLMGWRTTLYISAMAGVILAIILWLIVRDVNPQQLHHESHVMDFEHLIAGLKGALKNPQIWINGIVGLLLYLSLSAFAELWGISYLQQAKGFSSASAASANSLIFLGWAIGAPFWGWLSDYIKRRCLPIIISTFFALIITCILFYMSGLSHALIYILLFLFGFFTSAQIIVFAICWEISSIKIAGTAIALTNMIIMVGGTVFQPALGKLLDLGWTGAMVEGARVYSPSAYMLAMSVLPISFAISFILMFFIRDAYGHVAIEE